MITCTMSACSEEGGAPYRICSTILSWWSAVCRMQVTITCCAGDKGKGKCTQTQWENSVAMVCTTHTHTHTHTHITHTQHTHTHTHTQHPPTHPHNTPTPTHTHKHTHTAPTHLHLCTHTRGSCRPSVKQYPVVPLGSIVDTAQPKTHSTAGRQLHITHTAQQPNAPPHQQS